MTAVHPVRLAKLHGLGNDFLVLVDLDDRHPIDADVARRLCDRHRGIGADGLLRATRPTDPATADLAMELLNADGSPAEMSGNGIRCFVHAALRAGAVEGPVVRVATAAGVRTVEVKPVDDDSIEASVEMGTATVERDRGQWSDVVDAFVLGFVDVGNPHLVVAVPDLTEVEVDVDGEALQRSMPGGINVEFVECDLAVMARQPVSELRMAVYERGVGVTEACGTGAVATVAAARTHGLTGDRATVYMPGGAVDVVIDDDGRATLIGPSVHIADLEVTPWR